MLHEKIHEVFFIEEKRKRSGAKTKGGVEDIQRRSKKNGGRYREGGKEEGERRAEEYRIRTRTRRESMEETDARRSNSERGGKRKKVGRNGRKKNRKRANRRNQRITNTHLIGTKIAELVEKADTG